MARPGAPEGHAKNQYEEKKEDAGNFEPQNTAYAAEGAQKTAHATGNAATGLTGSSSGGSALNGRTCGRLSWGGVGRSLGSGSHALACDAPGNAEADAQGAADGVRFHSVYDGSSGPC